jgi:hypothetical protein
MFCEICRVVQFTPTRLKDPRLHEISHLRTVAPGDILARCSICKRPQLFSPVAPVDPRPESDRETDRVERKP